MRVVAVREGFYAGSRRRIGAEFDMADSVMKKDKDGKPVLPSWVKRVSASARKEIADAVKAAQEKGKLAALAAAGPKRAGTGYASAEDDPRPHASPDAGKGSPEAEISESDRI